MQKPYDYICALLSLCLLILLIPQHSFAQSSDRDSQKIKVMVLGTFHFHHAPDYYDILSPAKQKELESVLDKLSEFGPTKIALEASYKDSSKFDSLYQQYRKGNHQLTSNERQQLGFRLADQLDHETVYAIDYKQPWPYGEVMGWAKENSPDFLKIYDNWKKSINSYQDSLYKNATLTEIFEWLNSNNHNKRLDEIRIQRSTLGGGSNFVGVKTMSSSYNRNLKIFANLIRYAQSGDRILVIYGSGHNYFLREFVQMHPDTKLVETLDYL